MIKKIIILFLCFVFKIHFLWASEVTFFPVEDFFLSQINTLRQNPLKTALNANLNILEISRKWKNITLKKTILPLNLDASLTNMAKDHILEMIQNNYIGHNSFKGNTLEQRANYFGYNGIFNGESIVIFGFENFISFDVVKKRLWNNLIKDAFYRLSAEGAPLLFPFYQDFGVALAGAQITLNEITYNAYILCLEFGVPGFSGYFLGRIYNNMPIPENSVSNLQITSFQNNQFYLTSNCFLDGSFYLPWDYLSDLWIKIHDPLNIYQDKILQITKPSLNIKIFKKTY